jgi:hypothetical protein
MQATTCNSANGYILYQQLTYTNSNPAICLNCRLIPYGMGAAGSSSCTCQAGFAYLTDWTCCYCYQSSYIDPVSGGCLSCTSLGSLMNQCYDCVSPYFYTSLTGCIYTPNLANGAKNGGCATGFTFDWYNSACTCQSGGYYVNSNGACVACASTDTNCRRCINNYYNDGHQCVIGSLIANYDYTTTFACKTGYAVKINLYNNQVISCACSNAAGYYQNGGNCIACSSSLPSGVTLANCQTCSNSAKFYKGSVECIYCPGVYLAIGTASINGCDCPPNYFWNVNTDQC